jgi:predicted DsbA family dithiol-disulfide isomerase
LGLSVQDLASCESAASKIVKEEVDHARTLGVRVTPTFLFGTGEGSSVTVRSGFTGAQPLTEFVKAIEGVLAGDGQAKRKASRK